MKAEHAPQSPVTSSVRSTAASVVSCPGEGESCPPSSLYSPPTPLAYSILSVLPQCNSQSTISFLALANSKTEIPQKE